jgi:hypothetical protein
MGHDVAGREVTDFVSFVARHAPGQSPAGNPRMRTRARRRDSESNQPAMKEAAP